MHFEKKKQSAFALSKRKEKKSSAFCPVDEPGGKLRGRAASERERERFRERERKI